MALDWRGRSGGPYGRSYSLVGRRARFGDAPRDGIADGLHGWCSCQLWMAHLQPWPSHRPSECSRPPAHQWSRLPHCGGCTFRCRLAFGPLRITVPARRPARPPKGSQGGAKRRKALPRGRRVKYRQPARLAPVKRRRRSVRALCGPRRRRLRGSGARQRRKALGIERPNPDKAPTGAPRGGPSRLKEGWRLGRRRPEPWLWQRSRQNSVKGAQYADRHPNGTRSPGAQRGEAR